MRKHNTYSAPRNKIVRKMYSFVFVRKMLAIILPKTLISVIRNLLFIRDKKPRISDSTRDFLKRHFESDVIELSKLLNKDFSKWIR